MWDQPEANLCEGFAWNCTLVGFLPLLVSHSLLITYRIASFICAPIFVPGSSLRSSSLPCGAHSLVERQALITGPQTNKCLYAWRSVVCRKATESGTGSLKAVTETCPIGGNRGRPPGRSSAFCRMISEG